MIAKLVFGLLLVGASTLVAGADDVMCLPAGQGGDAGAATSPLVAAPAAFNNLAEYRQWQQRCGLGGEDYQRTANAYLLVDTRAAADYALGHVNQSINVPLASVKTRSFLRNKRFLMLGAGYERVALLHACKQLHAAGYTGARLLDGGLLSLSEPAGKTLDAAVIEQLQTIPVASLLYDKGYEAWIVFDLASTVSRKLASAFGDIFSFEKLPPADVPRQILANRAAGAGAATTPVSIVVIDESGQHYQAFRQWSEQFADNHLRQRLFYLRGGIRAFDAFVKAQYAMLSKQSLVLTRPQGCAR